MKHASFRCWLVIAMVLAAASRAVALEPIFTLAPSDVPEGFGNGFGWSVAISGDYVAVGAPFDPWYNGDATGAVYIFRRVGPRWVQQAKLVNPDPIFEAQFGLVVAMERDVLAVSAPVRQGYYSCDLRDQGAVYVFRRDDAETPDDFSDDTWRQEGLLTSPDPRHGVGLGIALAVGQDVVVAGSECGESVEVYRHGTRGFWVHETTLVAPGQEPQKFGRSVDIYQRFLEPDERELARVSRVTTTAPVMQRIIVGAPWYDMRRGAAYVFRDSNGHWVSDGLLTVEGQVSDIFGCAESVAITDTQVMVGCPYEGGQFPLLNFGAVYAFGLTSGGNWLSEARIIPSTLQDGGEFGWVVKCNAGECLIGQGTHREPSAYLFKRVATLWTETLKLGGPPYPLSISFDGNYAALGNQVYAVRNLRSLATFAAFQNCFGCSWRTGHEAECGRFGQVTDSCIDLFDFGELMATYVGP